MDQARRIEVLEQENDILRERVRCLEGALVGTFETPIEWALTPSERCVFGVMVQRTVATKDAIQNALYFADGREGAGPQIVNVFICKIRKKLTPFGIEIKNHWGDGYSLDAATRAQFGAAA